MAGGTLVNYALFANMAKNHHPLGSDRALTAKAPQKGGLYEFRLFDHMNVKIDALHQNPWSEWIFYN